MLSDLREDQIYQICNMLHKNLPQINKIPPQVIEIEISI